MANTTFNGPVRSENGFETVSKNAATGVITITSGNKMINEAVANAGIEGTAGVYVTQVERFKSDTTTNVNIVKTTILLDLTGLTKSATAGDIIGKDGDGVAYFARVTTADQGVIFGIQMTCLEVPSAGDGDIDIYSATEGTGVEDTAITALTESQITNGGALTAGSMVAGGAISADQYLYLVNAQGAGAGTYTGGRLLIELTGYDVAT
jgi:hypothetical protein